ARRVVDRDPARAPDAAAVLPGRARHDRPGVDDLVVRDVDCVDVPKVRAQVTVAPGRDVQPAVRHGDRAVHVVEIRGANLDRSPGLTVPAGREVDREHFVFAGRQIPRLAREVEDGRCAHAPATVWNIRARRMVRADAALPENCAAPGIEGLYLAVL